VRKERGKLRGKGWLNWDFLAKYKHWREGGREVIGWSNASPTKRDNSEGGRVLSGWLNV
jgi:hypothetical protein